MASIWTEPRKSGREKTTLVRWRSRKLGISGSEICYSKAEVEDFVKKKRDELRRLELGLPPPIHQERRQITVAAFLEEHERHCQLEKASGTYERHDKPMIESLRAHLPKILLLQVDAPMLQAWNFKLSKTYNPTTRGMRIKSMRAMFAYAKRMGYRDDNPGLAIDVPDSDETGRELRDHELEAIFTTAAEPLWRAGQFSLECGPRVGEICRKILWDLCELVHLKNERIMLLSHALERQPELLAAWPKLPEGVELFGRVPARQRKTKRKVKKDLRFPINERARIAMGAPQAAGFIFDYSKNTIQQQMVEVCERAKVEDASFHDFRHTFATRFLAGGGHAEDLLDTKLWAKYESLERYIHVRDATLAQRFAPARGPNCPLGAHQKRNARGRRLRASNE